MDGSCQDPKEVSLEGQKNISCPLWAIQNTKRCVNVGQFTEGLHHQYFIRSVSQGYALLPPMNLISCVYNFGDFLPGLSNWILLRTVLVIGNKSCFCLSSFSPLYSLSQISQCLLASLRAHMAGGRHREITWLFQSSVALTHGNFCFCGFCGITHLHCPLVTQQNSHTFLAKY